MKNHKIKVKEANQRAEARSKRSVKDQLALIAKRPGESKRETKRLTGK